MSCNDYDTASYRGINFEFLGADYTGGRRVTSHEYPFIDIHYNEDMGDKPERINVRGCFHGKDFRDKLWLAKRIWEVKGNGVLFEPTQNKSHEVTLVDWTYNFSHTRINYVDFSLTFVEKADDPYPSNLLGLLSGINGVIDEMIEGASNAHVAVSEVINIV